MYCCFMLSLKNKNEKQEMGKYWLKDEGSNQKIGKYTLKDEGTKRCKSTLKMQK